MSQTLQNIIRLLDEGSINYTLREHEATPTSADSARARGESMSSGAKAIVYKIQDQFHLFVIAADRSLDTKKMKLYFKDQGMRVKKSRFANQQELMDLTGLPPGAVPPFGHPILPLVTYVDPSLLKNERISFNAGSLRHSITIQLEDYIKIAKPIVFSFASNH